MDGAATRENSEDVVEEEKSDSFAEEPGGTREGTRFPKKQ
jgi:hypothetical protein